MPRMVDCSYCDLSFDGEDRLYLHAEGRYCSEQCAHRDGAPDDGPVSNVPFDIEPEPESGFEVLK